ncbi:methylated-DNA--[protein]-cysteine S-methyltransferase [Alteromonas pelagimontana]|uniref:Methylated-DNA--protein-cysteine methyltransferase n=1 Tax=Alteromonas pelagimontana TaxID=1858656 RepID=A0A6M4MC86_9ALTE|nr:methylated-DNA--[protein]-cysteine S-methyltransferase [Alteromonas pelagimontana]QJR80752.1 methylated-DNA--[protein]-cysteine S-methyltransferase [Alteromonas pelagimontana]
MYNQKIKSPCGSICVTADDNGITAVRFIEPRFLGQTSCDLAPSDLAPSELTQEACQQLQAYFAGKLQRFDLPLSMQGTPFQQQVWRALSEVEFGTTASYGIIAQKVGRPKGARAVGMANGRNPIAIVVPCHRIIGSNGRLTGYAGGMQRKAYLLNLEGVPVTA